MTKRSIDLAQPERTKYVLWDGALPGFGLSVAPSGTKSFVLRYRPRGGGRGAAKRFITVGRFGPVTVEQARQSAMEILGQVAQGHDPAAAQKALRDSISLVEAAREFLSTHVRPKRKAKTFAFYEHAIEKKIIPALGRRKLHEVSAADVARLHSSMSDAPSMANRVIAVLSSLYSWADWRGMISNEHNPARRLDKFRENPRERFLTSDELARLGNALREAETTGIPWQVDETRISSKHVPKPEKRFTIVSPHAVAAIRLLLLTGCRRNEILNLRWEEVDLERGIVFLPDSKTGAKKVLLSTPALEVLSRLPRLGRYVIAGPDAKAPRVDLKRPWAAIRRHAGLEGMRIHDLRHSYASVGVAAGLGLPIIGRLLGHSHPATTAKYAHFGDDPVRRASEVIAQKIAAVMGDG